MVSEVAEVESGSGEAAEMIPPSAAAATIEEPIADSQAPVDEAQEAIEILEELEELGRKVDEAKYEYELRKSRASDAKKHWESLAEQLSDKTQERRRRREAERMKVEEAKRNDANRPLLAKEVDESEEAWRHFKLDEWFKGAELRGLHEAKLFTFGDYADREKQEGFELTDLPGVGPGRAEKMRERFTEFWAQRPWEDADESDEPTA